MFLVSTFVGQSPIHGLGVFVQDFAPRGTLLWQWEAPIDQSFTRKQVEKMSPRMRTFLSHFAYCWQDRLYLCGDNARFTNHSTSPTSAYDEAQGGLCAVRDLQAGEELTEDYFWMGTPWTEFHGLVEPGFTGHGRQRG